MKPNYRTYSEEDRLAYNTGFNQGYQMSQTLIETDEVYKAIQAKCKEGKPLQPYSQGILDGIKTKDYLDSFLRGIEGGRHKDDFDLDL